MHTRRHLPIYILLIAFLLGGIIHFSFYGVIFSYDITQLYFGVLVIFWMVSVNIRVIDRQARNPMLAVGFLLLLYFILQVAGYNLFKHSEVMVRILWYAYYIPMILIPALILYISLHVRNNGAITDPSIFRGILATAGLLILGFLTNDLHGLAFTSAGAALDKENYTHGVLFYLYVIYIMVVLAASVWQQVKTVKERELRNALDVPLRLMAAGIFCCVGAEVLMSVARNFSLWNTGEAFTFYAISYLEISIYLGLIPSNQGYLKIFRSMPIPAKITGADADQIIASGKEMLSGESVRHFSMAIAGGEMAWTMDISAVQELNRQIAEMTEKLVSRTELLKSENAIKEEREALASRNSLYTGIAFAVRSQIDKMNALLAEDAFTENLPTICVLNAYVKRRSNLELLKASQNEVPVKELQLSVNESLEYLRLCGVESNISCSSNENVPVFMLIQAYEYFEEILENTMESLKSIAVFISYANEELTLRMLIDAETFSFDMNVPPEQNGYFRKVSVSKEDRDTLMVFSVKKGGNV